MNGKQEQTRPSQTKTSTVDQICNPPRFALYVGSRCSMEVRRTMRQFGADTRFLRCDFDTRQSKRGKQKICNCAVYCILKLSIYKFLEVLL